MNASRAESHEYVDSAAGIKALASDVRKAHAVALDTEANSLYNYYARVCLIQLSFDGRDYVVDPLADADIAPLLHALAPRRLLFHGGDYDLRMMLSSNGFKATGEVFDTMIGAQLLGYEQQGLVALADKCLGVQLSKHGQKSNWTHRPLSPQQILYAVDDTRYLERIAAYVLRELEQLDRLEWHHESCRHMVRSAYSGERRDTDDAWRIRGAGVLSRCELAYLHGVWRWRDREAQEADRPPFKVMGNQLLIDIATWRATDPDAPLAEGPRLPRNCTGRRFEKLVKALERVDDLPESRWPKPPKRREPQADVRHEVHALRNECTTVAHDLGIAPSVLAPRAALVNIARLRPQTIHDIMTAGPLLRWQSKLIKPAVAKALG